MICNVLTKSMRHESTTKGITSIKENNLQATVGR